MKVPRTRFIAGFAALVMMVSFASAQEGEYREQKQAVVLNSIIPLRSDHALSATEQAGKRLYIQKCSVCHLPGIPSYKPYGPLLDQKLVNNEGEDTVRSQIMQGSTRMPGWQYTLKPAEVDEIIAFLKTLDFSKK